LGAMACGIYACSDETSELSGSGDPAGQGPNGSGGATSTSGQGGDPVTVSVGQGGSGQGGSCVDLVVEPTYDIKPADIIFVIDNSGSMSDEIDAVEQNINVNFASIIQNSGVDYQVIMVTDHGTNSYNVCIGPPLSGTTLCSESAPVNVPGQFYHYSVNVQSVDSMCKMVNTLYGPTGGGEADHYSLEPNGWSAWLRPEAVKVFVEITDDAMSCTWQGHPFTGNSATNGQAAALELDSTLLGLAPGQFGTTANRNYIFYSIVGLASKPSPNELDPYSEFEPIVAANCNCTNPAVCVQNTAAYNAGYGYQWLSKGTGALRFPVCNTASYDAMFSDIASGVIDAVTIPCEFDFPEPEMGELNLDTIDVLYTPGGSNMPIKWTKVGSESECGPGKYYLDEVNEKIILCDEACAVAESDLDGKIEVSIECGKIET
jgi:hypothetical protein